MTQIGRRHFCAALGAGLVGLAGVVSAGCSSTDGNSASTGSEPDALLAGLSLQVHSDPG